ncbi:MAG: flavoprotein [Phycisphaerales bacterium]
MTTPPPPITGPPASAASAGGHAPAFRGRRILVGLTGGIAAYKTAMVVSRLSQAGAEVTVAMTEGATRFITPLTLQALSGRPVYTGVWEHIESQDPQHIALATRADLAIVAPCSMDCLARLATGRADDVVTLILAAVDRRRTPVLLAPAMNSVMWSQPATQRNLGTLREDGFQFVGPDEGWQACRTVGVGRMAEPEAILARASALLASPVSSRP